MGTNNTPEKISGCPLGNASCPIDETIAALKQEIQQLKQQVSTDPLTGLFNVRHLRFTLEQEMERTYRSHQPTTFIILDVDHFKRVNDNYGHVVGDKVLIHLASLIKTEVRKIDIPCRYGGEEFAVILPSTPILIGIQVAERIRKKIEETPFIDHEHNLAITISAGIDSFTRKQNRSLDNFIDGADQQLYKAKQLGRNRIHHASEKAAIKSEVTQSEKDALFNQLSDDSEE